MSYDIELRDPVTGKVLQTDQKHHLRGGTYVAGGTTDMTLNVTYNYSLVFCKVLDREKGIRFIYGMTGADSIPILQAAADKLKDNATDK